MTLRAEKGYLGAIMKNVTVTNSDSKVVVEVDIGADISELCDMFFGAAIGCGFTPQTVTSAMWNHAEEWLEVLDMNG